MGDVVDGVNVVGGSIEFGAIRTLTFRELLEVVVIVLLCTFNFSLKEFSICAGKVWPFSQISMSFLIFSYKTKNRVSGSSYGKVRYAFGISSSSKYKLDHEHYTRLLSSNSWAYLLIIGSRLGNIVHQCGQKLLYFMDTSGKGTILGRTVYRLSGALG